MADINFGILDTQMPGRIAAIPQQQQAQQAQNAMQLMQVQQSMGQNELAKYQLSAAQRADQTQNAINKAYQNAIGPNGQIDYAAVRRALAAGGAGSAIPKLESERLTAEKLAAQTRASTTTADRTNFELTGLKIDRARTAITAASNSEAALAAINKSQAAGDIDAADAAILTKELGNDATFAEGQKRVLQSMLSAKDRLAQQAIKTVDTDRGGFIERQTYDAQGIAVGNPIKLPKTAAPSTDAAMLSASIRFNPETGTFENVAPAGMSMRPPSAAGAVPRGFPAGGGVPPTAAPAAIGGSAMIPTAQPSVNAMRPGAAPTAAPAVVGRGPSPREIREARAKGFIFNPDGSMSRIPGGPADRTTVTRTPVQETKFIKDLATDFTTVTATAQGMQDVIDSITDVRNSPGLAGATGISGMIYSMPGSQAATAETNLTNLKGKVTSLGQTLANASGKIGPMAVQEWTIVRDMVAALDKAVSKGEKITLTEIEKIEFTAKNIVDRVKAKFEGQYGEELSDYPQFATISAPKSRFGGKITRPLAAATPAGNSVTAPNGQTYTFDTPEQAKAYRQAAGIK